ncbi:unnamed protein product [Amoebophrya sp. A25]|nr:unnamed protein product [Amoebophrya sp. A25]|eukprot:GSA25T00017570001.1
MSVDLSGGGASAPNPISASAPVPATASGGVAESALRAGSAGMVESAVGTAKTVMERSVAEVRNFVEQNPSQVRATVFFRAATARQLVYQRLSNKHPRGCWASASNPSLAMSLHSALSLSLRNYSS